MKGQKALFELLLLILGFGIIWVIFTQVDIFPEANGLEFSIEKEEKLGGLLLAGMLQLHPEVHNPTLDSSMHILEKRLMNALDLTDFEYNILVIDHSAVNAVTLPGGNILIFEGLVKFVDAPEELSAILSHEIGHVEHRHIIKKLIKELSIGLITSVFGGNDPVLIGELTKIAGSTVFDRKQEREADEFALDLMLKSNINPKIMAAFFRRIANEFGGLGDHLELLSTHPNNNSRIRRALEFEIPENFESIPIEIDWGRVKSSLGYEGVNK